MDTLKRYGSLRLSKRGRKQRDPDKNYGDNDKSKVEPGGSLLSEPRFATLGRKQKSAKAFFTISFKDVVVSTLNGYQPTHLKATFERHRQSFSSGQVLWEPSLRCTSSGSGVWHPPFIIHTTISVPKLSKSNTGEKDSLVLRQKDAYVSIENLDLKGKKKLLAKARLNLSDYFESAAEKDVSFRLKLHPESSKIESASIDLTLRKSVKDPRAEHLDVDVTMPLFPDDPVSLGSPSQKSLDIFLRKNDVPKEDDSIGVDSTKIEMPLPTTPSDKSIDLPIQNSPIVTPAKTNRVVPEDGSKPIVPNIITPPPLPPRKPISLDSPPPSSHIHKPDVTSTPLNVTNYRSNNAITETAKAPTNTDRSPSPVFACPVAPLAIAEDSKTITRIITPPEKEIDWGDDDEPEVPQQSDLGINVSSTRPSPKAGKPTEKKKLSADKDLIEWAESLLVDVKPQVKVTNLTSSWRNGLGFCLILQKSYPSLIPLQELSMEHAKDNNEIAFDVADMLDIDTDVVRHMALTEDKTDKAAIADFLRQLRLLPTTTGDAPSTETVIEFQKKWFKRRKYFKKEVGELCKKEEEEEQAKAAAILLAEKVAKEEKEVISAQEREEEQNNVEPSAKDESDEPSKTANDKPEVQEPCSSNHRARRLIEIAHQDSSSYEDPTDSVCSDLVSSCASNAGGGRGLRESGTILEELSQLASEEEQISGELEKLELALRNQDVEKTDEDEFEALLQKYVSMVNEKNSLVRRQMQLNIAEKERAIEHKKDKLQRQLQKFSDLDESQKTEAMRLEEEIVLQHYVEAVNEKNELVHDLDSQEKLIAEDERIRTFIANRDSLTSSATKAVPGANKHNIMNEFFDFFKTSSVSSGFSKK